MKNQLSNKDRLYYEKYKILHIYIIDTFSKF